LIHGALIVAVCQGCVRTYSRTNAAVFGSRDGLVKLELSSPERLVSEGVVAKCLPALFNHLPGVFAHQAAIGIRG